MVESLAVLKGLRPFLCLSLCICSIKTSNVKKITYKGVKAWPIRDVLIFLLVKSSL